MKNWMILWKSLQETSFLIKGVNETVKNEVKEQKGGFLGILSATLGARKHAIKKENDI